jgi:methylmalonyl-CoA mutase N-terminal domain/subunit
MKFRSKDMGRKPVFHPERLAEIRRQKERWRKDCLSARDRELEKAYHSYSDIPVQLLYTPDDVQDLNYEEDLGYSGQPPFTRGIYPNMYRGRPFTIRQLAGFGPPEECNKRLQFLLEKGATGLNIVLDMPTIRGYDSDAVQSEGNVGQCGVALDSIEDLHALFADIPIDRLSVSLVTHLPSVTVVLLSMYMVMAEERGMPLDKLAGTSQNDFLMETAIGSAPEIIPPADSFRIQCDVIEHVTATFPRWNPVSYNGYNLREAGTDAVMEVGIAIANALATAKELMRRGRPPDTFLPRFSFFWDLHNDFFEEIAKCRASRRLWYKVVTEDLKAGSLRSQLMRFHVQTAGITLSSVEPFNNIARAAIQGLAAVLGGAQSLHIDSYDEAFSAPTELAALVSLRTQQILQAESGVTRVVDPLGGSYYLENLTTEVEKRIALLLDKVEDLGGIVRSVETGWLHDRIADFGYRQQRAIESGDFPIVGVNYQPSSERSCPVEVFRYPETRERQIRKLQQLRAARDNLRLKDALANVRKRCSSGENLMPHVMEAVRARATLGEIQAIFRDCFGLWQFPLH